MKKVMKFLILISAVYITSSLECGDNEIEGCRECGLGENISKCSLCEDKYFLVLDGEKCIRCDDEFLGMAGCNGNCKMIKSEKNVICKENSCKDGYYEIYPGTCAECSFLFDGCSKCSYINDTFNCLECKNENYYISTLDNKCRYCYISGCKKCLNNTFCEKCNQGYVLYPNGNCIYYDSNCKTAVYSEEKERQICLECIDDYILYPNSSCIYSSNCKISIFSEIENRPICKECQKGYALYPNGTCNDYEYRCKNKTYSEEEGKGICLECEDGYYLDNKNKCEYCNIYQNKYYKNFNGCKKCHLKKNDILICDQAEKYYYVSSSGEYVYYCRNFISNCDECSYHSEEDLNHNILRCDKCQDNLYLSSDERSCKYCNVKENGCIICSDNQEQAICDKCTAGYGLLSNGSCYKCSDRFGEGCISCSTSPFDFLLYCTSCSDSYTLGNDGKCKHCENDINLIGCKSCKPYGMNGFECLSCLDDYYLMNGRCHLRGDNEFSTCLEMENIGRDKEIIYSCKKCKNDNYNDKYIFAIKNNNAKICVEASSGLGLNNCELSQKEIVGENNYTCIKCNSLFSLEYDSIENKQICKGCAEGYYKYEYSIYFSCYTCPYKCKKCHTNENNNAICDECHLGYIKTLRNSCKECNTKYCEECSLDENSEVICSKYKEPYFLNNISEIDMCINYIDYCSKCSYLNGELKCKKCMEEFFLNKDGICEHCYINKNIGPACISCTDNEDIKNKAPCQKCNGKNYFLTKENKCIFCKSEKYGGLFCNKCGYININNEETIGCVECSYSYILIEGKCFNIKDFFCEEYGAYLNNNNEKVYGCIKCKENYYLSKDNKCKAIEKCNSGYQSIENSCIKIFPDSDDEIIEGCLSYEYKYNNYYCINCDSNYITKNGYCHKKINNPFLSDCYLFDLSGFLKCERCSNSYNYLNSTLLCYNKYYGYCYEYENIGNNLNPIYSCKSCSYISISYENGMKICHNSNIFDNRCEEGIVNSNYYTDIYTCTKCKSLYILSYSNYYEKNICKYIYEDEKKYNNSIYDSDTGISSTNGQCNDGYFTRNGKVCIKCDDLTNGMPGCGGKCSFKINREYQLQCEVDNCKDSYFETLPGKCELCNKVFSGCKSCNYIINDKKAIFQPERKRKLICNKCDDGLFLVDGVCQSCMSIINGCLTCHKENNLYKCDEIFSGYYIDEKGVVKRCKDNCYKCTMINENGINKVKCNEVYSGYYLDEEENIKRCEDHCLKCSMVNENGINKVKCSEAYYGYFANEEGKVKECSDEKEGIANCYSCSFDPILKCNSCLDGYQKVDNKCKSIEEITNLEGCISYEKNEDDNTYYCKSCYEDYLYINNLRICVKKTEETYYCKGASLIEKGGKTFYNCTSCINYNYNNVKNSDGYFKCYFSELFNSNYCKLITNIGTFKEPFFICEECYDSYSNFALTVDENENQICDYNQFTINCIKGKKTHIYMKDGTRSYYSSYNYNCTKCKAKYALEYDDYTNSNKCTPLECGVPFCKKCFDDDVYTCQECLPGYTFNKLGFCYIKPKVTPTITFKDIFRFALNGLIGGNDIFRFSFALRGLTRNKITEKHSFIISTMFKSTNLLRGLEENKTYKTSCEFLEEMENNDDSEIKFVDYNCYFDSNEDLRGDYKMDSVNEDNYGDKENLKSFNLNELVKNTDDISKENSLFDQNELNKYILFTIDNSSKLIQSENIEDFNFILFGITNKPMTNIVFGKLTFANTDNKEADCEIDATNKDNATLICKANTKEIDFTKKVSIKEQEIEGEYNNIYFDGLSDVIFLFSKKDESGKDNQSKNYKGLIIGLVVGLTAIIAIVVLIWVYCFKKKSSQKPKNNSENLKIYNNKNII